jgi:hypothetical protein
MKTFFTLSLFFFLHSLFQSAHGQVCDSTMVTIYRAASDWDPIENENKYVLTFNTAEKKLSEKHFLWDGSAWIPSSLDSFIYTSDTIISVKRSFIWSLNHWENYFQELYSYQNDTQITSDLVQHWDGFQWNNNNQRLYTYSPTYKIIQDLFQLYSSGWNDYIKTVYVYDVNDSLSEQSSYSKSGGVWINYSQALNYFNASGDDTLSIHLSGDSITWDSSAQEIKNFDLQHRDTQIVHQRFSSGAWKNDRMEKYYYS